MILFCVWEKRLIKKYVRKYQTEKKVASFDYIPTLIVIEKISQADIIRILCKH